MILDDEYVVIKKSELEALREAVYAFRKEFDPLTALAQKSPWDDHLHSVSIGVYIDSYNAMSTRQTVSRELIFNGGDAMAPVIYERSINQMIHQAPEAIKGLQRYFTQLRYRQLESRPVE